MRYMQRSPVVHEPHPMDPIDTVYSLMGEDLPHMTVCHHDEPIHQQKVIPLPPQPPKRAPSPLRINRFSQLSAELSTNVHESCSSGSSAHKSCSSGATAHESCSSRATAHKSCSSRATVQESCSYVNNTLDSCCSGSTTASTPPSTPTSAPKPWKKLRRRKSSVKETWDAKVGRLIPCLGLCVVMMLVYVTTGVIADDDDLSGGLYERFGASACVHAENFASPEVQHRLRTALIGFPRDDMVRTLLHDLTVKPKRGWWNNSTLHDDVTSVLIQNRSRDYWFVTTKGELHDRGSQLDRRGQACVSVGGVRVRADDREGGDKKHMWTWMERTAWKVTDGYLKRVQLKEPWVLPIYLLPSWLEHRLEDFSLDLLPARVQHAVDSASTRTRDRLQSHLALATSLWRYAVLSVSSHASSLWTSRMI